MHALIDGTNADTIAVGSRLRQARETAGLSRRQLSERTGIPHKSIEKFEYGTQDPSLSRLIVLCRTLGLSLEDLMGIEDGGASDPRAVGSDPEAASDLSDSAVTAVGDVDIGSVVRSGLAKLDEMRSRDFETSTRRSRWVALHISEELGALEPEELTTLARERDLFRGDVPTARELSDAFDKSFPEAEAAACEIGNRIVDSALLGVDLYAIQVETLHGLADQVARDHRLEGPGFLQTWGQHATLVPKLRPIFWQLAAVGRSPDFSDVTQFPRR